VRFQHHRFATQHHRYIDSKMTKGCTVDCIIYSISKLKPVYILFLSFERKVRWWGCLKSFKRSVFEAQTLHDSSFMLTTFFFHSVDVLFWFFLSACEWGKETCSLILTDAIEIDAFESVTSCMLTCKNVPCAGK